MSTLLALPPPDRRVVSDFYPKWVGAFVWVRERKKHAVLILGKRRKPIGRLLSALKSPVSSWSAAIGTNYIHEDFTRLLVLHEGHLGEIIEEKIFQGWINNQPVRIKRVKLRYRGGAKNDVESDFLPLAAVRVIGVRELQSK